MPLTPIASAAARGELQAVRWIATDLDGTLTQQGKLTATLLQALESLAQAGIAVLIVTGRSAGWVSSLVRYLPVTGAIAENGGLLHAAERDQPTLLAPLSNLDRHRQQLADAFRALQAHYPELAESADNRFRMTDWTFDVAGLSPERLQALGQACREWGWEFTYSTVQCHIKPPWPDKATGAWQAIERFSSQVAPHQVLAVGDSPNDDPLFDAEAFPLSAGVANIRAYTDALRHQPAYITTAAEGAGFSELARLLAGQA